MTYCAGWKYANSVYLIADSLATKLALPVTPSSTFGELHGQIRAEYVEECLLKLVPIAPGAAVAFAGDVALATQIIEFLQGNFGKQDNITKLFSSLTSSLGPFDRTRPVEIIFAYSSSNESVELAHWNSIQCLVSADSDYYQIGSLTSYHSALTPRLLSDLVRGRIDPERVLPIITALVQSYGVHDNLIEQNIGGLIFGLRCNGGAIAWQDDTNFVIYDNLMSTTIFASALVRDNAVAVTSSATNDTRVFMHSASTASSSWMERWKGLVQYEMESDNFRYWVFIRIPDKCITVIRRDDPKKRGQLVRSTYLGSGKFDIAINTQIMDLLRQPLNDLQDGSLPLRINFRNDPMSNE